MGKTGFVFKLASSETAYVVSTCPDLGVFGDVFGRAWERVTGIEMTPEALKHYFWKPELVLKKLEESYWYQSSLEDERYIKDQL